MGEGGGGGDIAVRGGGSCLLLQRRRACLVRRPAKSTEGRVQLRRDVLALRGEGDVGEL